MMECFAHPTPGWIGGLFASAVVVLSVAGWLINFGGPELSAYAFPPILIGLILLIVALAQLALWALNRVQPPPST